MRTMTLPDRESRADRTCPRCGRRASVHARSTRAVHDWEVTFVESLRLRCCGRTFTATPRGVSPRSRTSDRVVQLARAFVAMGVSLRRGAALLGQAGVRVTPQAIQAWCLGVPREARARVELAVRAGGQVGLELRPDLWANVFTGQPKRVSAIFARELGAVQSRRIA